MQGCAVSRTTAALHAKRRIQDATSCYEHPVCIQTTYKPCWYPSVAQSANARSMAGPLYFL